MINCNLLYFSGLITLVISSGEAFSVRTVHIITPSRFHQQHIRSQPEIFQVETFPTLVLNVGNEEEWSDFDDYVGSSSSNTGADNIDFVKLLQEKSRSRDLTACSTRQFSLGPDLILSNYVGNMGFDEVTDWEYYFPGEDEDRTERQVIQPNPFDSSKYVSYV